MDLILKPIIFNLNLAKNFRKLIKLERFRSNLSRADWTMFSNQLELIASNTAVTTSKK